MANDEEDEDARRRRGLHSMRLLAIFFCFIAAGAALALVLTSAVGVPFKPPGVVFVTFGTVWSLPAVAYVIMAGLVGFYGDVPLVALVFVLYMVPNVLLGVFQLTSALYVMVTTGVGLASIQMTMAMFIAGFTLLTEALAFVLLLMVYVRQTEQQPRGRPPRRRHSAAELQPLAAVGGGSAAARLTFRTGF